VQVDVIVPVEVPGKLTGGGVSIGAENFAAHDLE
jgi:hypothetical protein